MNFWQELLTDAIMNADMQRVFEATIEKHGKWWVGWVDAVPGANSQGHTMKEVQENLKEAVAMVLEANKELQARSSVKRYKKKIVLKA